MPRSIPALRALLLLGAVLASPAAALAQGEPLVTDRPDFTESTALVPLRRVQVEGGYTFERDGAERRHSVGEVLVRVGVAAPLELRIGLSSYALARAPGADLSGVEDSSLGVKLRLLRRADGAPGVVPDASLIVASSLPTGARALRSDGAQPEAKLALGWSLSERVSLASNLNYAAVRADDARHGELGGSASVAVSLAERVGGYAEYFGFVPTAPGMERPQYLNGGLTFLLSDDFQVDARVGRGIGAAGGDYFLGVGIARRW